MEIERKFLVNREEWNQLPKPEPFHIIQAYLVNTLEKTIRVRIKNDKAFLTIKGPTIGLSRSEFEYEIPLQDAKDLIDQFAQRTIEKYRFEIKVGQHLWEVDVFLKKLEGLILAEIELESENESFEHPNWITEEVSFDPSYFNSNLEKKC